MRPTQDNLLAEFHRARDLQTAGQMSEAAALCREIVAAAPQSAEARVNLGGVLLELGEAGAAEAEMRAAVRLRPDAAFARYNLGRVLHLVGRWEEAEAEYRAALALAPADPKPRLGLGQLYLALADYARGWPLYEARSEIPSQNAPKLALPNEWAGEPIAGKRLLLWPEQGYGDQIQFARFAPVLKAMGAAVTLVAPAELSALFATLGVEVLTQVAGPMSVPTPDHWSLVMSVPHRLGTTLQTLPAAPYLAVPAERRAKWAGYAGERAVGVVWRGRQTPGAAHRSLPGMAALKPLADAGARLIDLSEPLGDFADLAAVIDQLELLVTIDTAAAHLAGALGKPCYVLLPGFRADWRWLQDRADSPWYPSLKLFRQALFGPWAPVVEAAADAYVAQFGS
jgi:hypothetical protein